MILSNKVALVYVIFQSPGPAEEEIEEEVVTLLGLLEKQTSTALLPAPRKVEIREITELLDDSYIFSALLAYATSTLRVEGEAETGKFIPVTKLETESWKLFFEHIQTSGKKFKNVQVAWLIIPDSPFQSSLHDRVDFV